MELLTRNQFMKRFNIGYDKMQKMIANNEVDYLPIADRIRIDDKTVSIEQFNAVQKRMIEAEARLEMILNLAKK